MSNANGFAYQVAAGKFPDLGGVTKFGRNKVLTSGAWELITPTGALTFLTAASTMRIAAGGDAADDAAGAGARSVRIYGLDENWLQVDELIATNGIDASLSTTTTFVRVNRAVVEEVGSYGAVNVADIDIETTGGTAQIQIEAGDGQAQFCVYTIPANRRGMLTHIDCNVSSAKAADVRLVIRLNANNTADTFGPLQVIWFRDGVTGRLDDGFPIPVDLPPYTDIYFEGNGTGAGVECEAEFNLLLENL